MSLLYNFGVFLMGLILPIVAFFKPKIKLFINGRKQTFETLSQGLQSKDKVIWVHCASLGEFEQGRPVIEGIKKLHPSFKIVLTFFSPSGYEVRKEYEFADQITYLPLDSKSNAKKFIRLTHPSLAIFVKYEFWPNLLDELKLNRIPTLLISGIFRKDQIFFKSSGKWMRKRLNAFRHFYVQNEASQNLLNSVGFENSTVSGDTRFDSVAQIKKQDNQLGFLDSFCKSKTILVAGSTWPQGEKYLVNYINNHLKDDQGVIIVPHDIDKKNILRLKKSINKKVNLFSEKEYSQDRNVFIIDTVGMLTKVFSYAHMAYIGGGFDKDGVHNVLEPAVFGIPLVIGPIYHKFEEAKDLVELGACSVAQSEAELNEIFEFLFENGEVRETRGKTAGKYIQDHLGATRLILNEISALLEDIS